jgi:integrase
MVVLYQYLSEEPDRRGNARLYVRRHGGRIRIREKPGTEEFRTAYDTALKTLKERATSNPKTPAPATKEPKPKSWGWLAKRYFGSGEFKALNAQSQRNRRNLIEACLRETHKGQPYRDCPVAKITAAKIKALRDIKVKEGKRGAANNRKKYLSAMFGWAVEEDLMTSNPARDVRRSKYATSGFHTWTVDEVRQFVEWHPKGTKPYVALCIFLFLGVRRQDACRIGKPHLAERGVIRGGAIRMVPRKTLYLRDDISEKPIIPLLADALEAGPIGELYFLETEYSQPFTAAGLGNKMRDWCDQAGLHHCSAHGLRKAGATIAAENGATAHQLMAIYDWSTLSQAEPYTRAADKKRLAGQAMGLLTNAAR